MSTSSRTCPPVRTYGKLNRHTRCSFAGGDVARDAEEDDEAEKEKDALRSSALSSPSSNSSSSFSYP